MRQNGGEGKQTVCYSVGTHPYSLGWLNLKLSELLDDGVDSLWREVLAVCRLLGEKGGGSFVSARSLLLQTSLGQNKVKKKKGNAP